ncbi:concanavalin A-like lectin/glucanase domain-containing protein [Dichotomocladium elegans]|nr:concanavalin A-like lectin/glucanase domain-containing protein [Dichotomocladium elegans]
MWYLDFRNGTAGLDINDIFVASYNISAKVSGTHSRQFGTQNVFHNTVSEGGLILAVTVENTTAMQCGGFGTRRRDILYGSFRSYIKTTPVSGTVGAMYIFNPGQEIDIELLSAVKPAQAYFAIHPGLLENGRASHLTHTNYHLGFDPTADFHEYRFDWMPGCAIFYIDGIEVQRLVTNIPTQPSRFMFNHWSDGNPKFSQGPPAENAYMEIMNITAFFNYSAVDPISGINTTGSPKCQMRREPCNVQRM